MIGDIDEQCNSSKRKSEILLNDKENRNNTILDAPTLDYVKKAKTSSKVLSFYARHDRFARLELLSTHTLYDLVATLCKHTPIGYEGADGPDDHMWYITFLGKEYESGEITCRSDFRASQTRLECLELTDNCELLLTYDYGTTSRYVITFTGSSDMEESEDETIFPRYKQKSDIPASYVKFMPENNDALNLDTMYPTLQKWIFNHQNGRLYLFQPGKKHIFGSMEKDRMGCRSMMHLPVKPGNLDTWLQCFEAGSKIKPKTSHDYLCYSWQSVVLLPRSQVTEKPQNKYQTQEVGFIDAIEVSDVYNDIVTKAFPKIAALAGLKKDKVVPKNGYLSPDETKYVN